MTLNLYDKLPSEFKNYKIEKIPSDASLRSFYRIFNNSNSYICMDSSKKKKRIL